MSEPPDFKGWLHGKTHTTRTPLTELKTPVLNEIYHTEALLKEIEASQELNDLIRKI